MRNRDGQAGVTLTIGFFFLFGVLGFCVDLGWVYYRKQAAQAAADAAALGAAAWAQTNGAVCGTNNVLCQTSSCSSLTTSSSLYAGCQYAKQNGFTDGSNNQTVSMTGGTGTPTNGPSNSMNYWVQATVSESVPELFLGLVGFNTANVRARSIAGVGYPAGTTASKYCVYILDTSGSQAFFASGSNSTLALTNCSIYVNSTANSGSSPNLNAYVLNGSASVTVSGGGAILVRGGANVNGTYCPANITCSSGSLPDPLASLAAPTFSGCDVTGENISNGTVTLNSGNKSVIVFCGGINISGGNVTFNPGVYVLNGGGLTIDSANTVVTGSGVTFFNTATSGHTVSPILISGQPNVTFSAPASGTYKGVLFYQDRTLSYSTANQINGKASTNITGTYYFPSTSLTFTGTNSSTATYTAVICKDLTLNGGAAFQWDSTGTHTGLSAPLSSYVMQ